MVVVSLPHQTIHGGLSLFQLWKCDAAINSCPAFSSAPALLLECEANGQQSMISYGMRYHNPLPPPPRSFLGVQVRYAGACGTALPPPVLYLQFPLVVVAVRNTVKPPNKYIVLRVMYYCRFSA